MAKQSVKDFYENEGWKYSESQSHDAQINENLSLVASDYVSKVRLRILENLGSGNNLLDIGCGPIQYREYLEYSKNFELRVCVDLSAEALKLAKMKLKEKGNYIAGDYLEIIDLNQAPFDGSTLINVLYHIERDKQEKFVRKILADLNPGARLVIVYSNPRTFSAVLTRFLVKVKKVFNRISSGGRKLSGVNPIYFYRYPLSFWRIFQDSSEVKILAWRTFSPQLEQIFFRRNLLGKLLLKVLFRLEELKWWVKFAEYPMVIITKPIDVE